jgi:hypothetical protein
MSSEPAGVPRSSAGAGSWIRPLVLAASCLVLGFVGGWVIRGDGGKSVVLPSPTATATAPTATAPTATGPTGRTSTAPPPAAPAVQRSNVTLAVLNGSSVTGLAARTEARAKSLGYAGANLVVGNAPTQTGPSTAYYRPGGKAAARLVATDLLKPAARRIAPLPNDGALTAQTPEAAASEVVLVLGAG